MPFRIRLSFLVVFGLSSQAAFSQAPQFPRLPARQVEFETILMRATGTKAELEEIRNELMGPRFLKSRQEYTSLGESLQRRSQVVLLAEPKLRTFIGRPANFLSGAPTFGTRLNVLPTLMSDGRIMVEFDLSSSEPSGDKVTLPDGQVIFGRTSDAIQTSVVLADGQGFVQGGWSVRQDVREVYTGPAMLKGIPLLRDVFCKRESVEFVVETICMGFVRFVVEK